MSSTSAGLVFLVVLVVTLAAAYRPLGDWMFRVFTDRKDWRVERGMYRVMGVDPDSEQRWATYARSALAFSVVSVLGLYALQRLQDHLFANLGFPAVPPALAWNTAVSFVTNTNWQAYSGESTMGHVVQTAGLAVQNFVSAAVGIAVAIALVRGFARKQAQTIGNFWVDLVRGTVRILLPISTVGAILLVGGGAIQTFAGHSTWHGLAGGTQTFTPGAIASQEAIKDLGTNGGGPFNANAAHPFENPTAWTNFLVIFLLLVIGFSLPRTFGRMVGDNRQGYAIVAVMALLFLGSTIATMVAELSRHADTVPTAIGSAMEGREARFGVPDSSVFATGTTLTSTGSIDSWHDSYSALGGGMLIVNMMFGEIAPGGTGSGLYGILVLAVITVFAAGLMVGRTPEYLGKKIGAREIKLASIYFLATPACVLIGVAAAMAFPAGRAAMLNHGAHGFSEILYDFTSASNNNGSAFAGVSVNTGFHNNATGLVMAFGRFLPMVVILALAGSLAKQKLVPASAGTLPTHRPQFVGFLAGVTVILVALTYLPMLALGPLAEGLH
jgi:K+-transporting ATPase ATPase A chain